MNPCHMWIDYFFTELNYPNKVLLFISAWHLYSTTELYITDEVIVSMVLWSGPWPREISVLHIESSPTMSTLCGCEPAPRVQSCIPNHYGPPSGRMRARIIQIHQGGYSDHGGISMCTESVQLAQNDNNDFLFYIWNKALKCVLFLLDNTSKSSVVNDKFWVLCELR